MRIYAQNKKVLGYEDGEDADMSWLRLERNRDGSIYIDKCGEVKLTAKQAAKVAEFLTQQRRGGQ